MSAQVAPISRAASATLERGVDVHAAGEENVGPTPASPAGKELAAQTCEARFAPEPAPPGFRGLLSGLGSALFPDHTPFARRLDCEISSDPARASALITETARQQRGAWPRVAQAIVSTVPREQLSRLTPEGTWHVLRGLPTPQFLGGLSELVKTSPEAASEVLTRYYATAPLPPTIRMEHMRWVAQRVGREALDRLSAEAYEAVTSHVHAALADVDLEGTDRSLRTILEVVGGTGRMTTVGVLDDGYDRHPAFTDNLEHQVDDVGGVGSVTVRMPAWNFATLGPGLPAGDHGTLVTGLATSGYSGIKAVLAQLHPFRQYDDQAMRYLAAQGARIVNLSRTVSSRHDVSAISRFLAANPRVLLVKSAGNNGEHIGKGAYAPEHYLSAASLPNLITVASADRYGWKSDHSNFNPEIVDVVARGEATLATAPGGGFRRETGTSLAAPQVTNLGAKVEVICPSLTAAEMKQIICHTADQNAYWRRYVRYGVINPERAMRTAGLVELVRRGVQPESAADRLGLSGHERHRIMATIATLQLGRSPGSAPGLS